MVCQRFRRGWQLHLACSVRSKYVRHVFRVFRSLFLVFRVFRVFLVLRFIENRLSFVVVSVNPMSWLAALRGHVVAGNGAGCVLPLDVPTRLEVLSLPKKMC